MDKGCWEGRDSHFFTHHPPQLPIPPSQLPPMIKPCLLIFLITWTIPRSTDHVPWTPFPKNQPQTRASPPSSTPSRYTHSSLPPLHLPPNISTPLISTPLSNTALVSPHSNRHTLIPRLMLRLIQMQRESEQKVATKRQGNNHGYKERDKNVFLCFGNQFARWQLER